MSTLAEKVDHLFRTVRPGNGKTEYTYEKVAAGCRAAGGPTISGAYVWMLRNGKRDNPTMKHMQALAGFFGVPPDYFFDGPESERAHVTTDNEPIEHQQMQRATERRLVITDDEGAQAAMAAMGDPLDPMPDTFMVIVVPADEVDDARRRLL